MVWQFVLLPGAQTVTLVNTLQKLLGAKTEFIRQVPDGGSQVAAACSGTATIARVRGAGSSRLSIFVSPGSTFSV